MATDAAATAAKEGADAPRVTDGPGWRESSWSYREFFQKNPYPMWLWDVETFRFLDVNDAAIARYGYSRDEFLAMAVPDIRLPEDDDQTLKDSADKENLGLAYWGAHRHRKRDGSIIEVEVTTNRVEVGGRPANFVMLNDVTERAKALRARDETQSMLAAVQRVGHIGIWYRNLMTGEVIWTEEMHRILGGSPEEPDAPVDAASGPSSRYTYAEDVELVKLTLEEARRSGKPYGIRHRVVRADGEVRWVHARGWYEHDERGTPIRMIGTLHDITEPVRAEERLAYLAQHDQLTGLANRAAIETYLQSCVTPERASDSRLALLFIDFEGLKAVNYTLGHAFGDRLLVEVGRRMTEQHPVRDGIVGRWGGDNFVIVRDDFGDRAAVSRFAKNLFARLSAPYAIGGHQLRLAPSIGVALYPDDAMAPDDLVACANTALAHAKEITRDKGARFFAAEMRQVAAERLATEMDLSKAILAGEFRLVYQPVIDLRTLRAVSAEALIRWQHPQRGLLGPESFLEVAEQSGLIVPIGAWVLREACAAARRWSALGTPLRVAVNVSGEQINREPVADLVRTVLDDTKLDASMLSVELTEKVIVRNVGEGRTTLQRLRDMGVSIAVDDFGTGNNSLAQLKHFPIDTLKIDRSFVRDLGRDPFESAIAEAIIALARGRNLTVIAEGAESREQVDILESLGCNLIQGFYFSKPLEPEEFERFLRAQAQRTNSFPKFSPRNKPISARGAFSRPSTMSSR
ncbi:MAG: EAL domain-containing protein [Firmicutes bacterium]|nr:EAL domain-containing protein [Bacillota bacterium]